MAEESGARRVRRLGFFLVPLALVTLAALAGLWSLLPSRGGDRRGVVEGSEPAMQPTALPIVAASQRPPAPADAGAPPSTLLSRPAPPPAPRPAHGPPASRPFETLPAVAVPPHELTTHSRAFDEARAHYERGRYDKAREAARDLVAEHAEPRAWLLLAASCCQLQDQRGAAEAASFVRPEDRPFLEEVCGKMGVSLTLGPPTE